VARLREEERHCSREREKDESEKEKAQKSPKNRGYERGYLSSRVCMSLQNNF